MFVSIQYCKSLSTDFFQVSSEVKILNQILSKAFDFAGEQKTLLNMATKTDKKNNKKNVKVKKLTSIKFFELHIFFFI